MRDVCVVGLGLIGGSVLRAGAAAGRKVWGVCADESDAAAAAAEGFEVMSSMADALEAAAERDALVVLAVPLPAVEQTLRAVAAHAPRCLLTDVTSVKLSVLDSVRRLAPEARYAGGHPMAGTAFSGWSASGAALFSGATWAVCLEPETELHAWREAAELALDVGGRVCPVDARTHDEVVARVSHLPHLLAEVLAAVGAAGGPLAASLAAGSFTDGTRVAGSRPELVRAMTEGNREALLGVLDEALGRFGAARGSLASTGGLAATINAGHEAALSVARHRESPRAELDIDLTAEQARGSLLGLGERGGRITSLDGDRARGEVPTP